VDTANDDLWWARTTEGGFCGGPHHRPDATGKTVGLVVPGGADLDLLLRSSALSLAIREENAFAADAASLALTAPAISPTAAGTDLRKATPNVTLQVTGKSQRGSPGR